MKQISAFFDFDNTLIRADSQDLEIRYLAKHGKLSPFFIMRVLAASFLYRRNLMDPESVIKLCLSAYKGQSTEYPVSYSDDLFRKLFLPRLNRTILHKLDEHRKAGHRIVIMSASVPHLVEPCMKHLGIEDMFCTRLEVSKGGRLSGKPDGRIVIGERKREILLKLQNEWEIDLSSSFAYSDHHQDLPFLESVGLPVAVNPTRELLNISLARGWRILEG